MDPPHDDVVEHRRVVVEQVGVLRPPDADLAEIVRERGLQAFVRIRTGDPHRAQVADVERDGLGATRHVLGEGARGIRERHAPAAEVDELGPELAVLGVER